MGRKANQSLRFGTSCKVQRITAYKNLSQTRKIFFFQSQNILFRQKKLFSWRENLFSKLDNIFSRHENKFSKPENSFSTRDKIFSRLRVPGHKYWQIPGFLYKWGIEIIIDLVSTL